MPWVEFERSNEGRHDGEQAQVVRRFKVWGVTKAAILSSPQSIPGGGAGGTGTELLPARGSQHPDFTGPAFVPLKLDSYDVADGEEPNVFVATANYSSTEAFRFPKALPDDTFLSYGGDAVPIDVRLPFAVREYGETQDPAKLIVGQWKAVDLTTTAFAARRVARVTVDVSLLPEALKAQIDEQVTNVHELVFTSGFRQRMQFVGWRHSQVSQDKIDVEYEWAIDPGSLLIPWVVVSSVFETGTGRAHLSYYYPIEGNGGIPSGGFEYDVGGGRLRKFLRKPFHTLQMLLPSDDRLAGAAGEPSFDNQPIAAEDLGGWTFFPGL